MFLRWRESAGDDIQNCLSSSLLQNTVQTTVEVKVQEMGFTFCNYEYVHNAKLLYLCTQSVCKYQAVKTGFRFFYSVRSITVVKNESVKISVC